MPPHHPKIPKAPEPTRVFFDPFNSSSTGHQRAGNRLSGSTSWRDSRAYKLAHQFGDTTGGGGKAHLSDLVGAGSENFRRDGRKDNGSWEPGAPGLREKGWQDIRQLMGSSKKRKSDSIDVQEDVKRRKTSNSLKFSRSDSAPERLEADHEQSDSVLDDRSDPLPQIFRGLTMHINGSTMPLVSDHRLKQLFVQHGGNSSFALGRKIVTHVILGEQGRGGGLASTKIQKENTTVHGKGIKYVSAKWVLDSIEKGVRQPEVRYVVADVKNRLGGSGQKSIANIFSKH